MKVDRASLLEMIGQTAGSIGSDGFYALLLDVFASAIPHDMAMVMRYPRFAAPDFLVSRGFSAELMDIYLKGFYRFDPFYRYWRNVGKCGVVPLSMAIAPNARKTDYLRIYQPLAKIKDELAVFLPGAGGSSIALFVERSKADFTAAEKRSILELYPLLSGLHGAHLRSILASLGSDVVSAADTSRPTLIVDKNNLRVHATRAWRDTERRQPDLKEALKKVASSAPRQDGTILHVQQLPSDFPLAPDGRIFIIEKPGLHPVTAPPEVAFDVPLTPREADIVKLVLQGYPTSEIARRLHIGIGTVKNHRARLYNKLDITTERELFLLYLQAIDRSKFSIDGKEEQPAIPDK